MELELHYVCCPLGKRDHRLLYRFFLFLSISFVCLFDDILKSFFFCMFIFLLFIFHGPSPPSFSFSYSLLFVAVSSNASMLDSRFKFFKRGLGVGIKSESLFNISSVLLEKLFSQVQKSELPLIVSDFILCGF